MLEIAICARFKQLTRWASRIRAHEWFEALATLVPHHKRRMHLCFTLIFCFIIHEAAPKLSSIQSVDMYLNDGYVQLPKLDADRMEFEQEAWAEKLEQYQFNRRALYAGTGLVGGVLASLLLYELFWRKSGSNIDSARVEQTVTDASNVVIPNQGIFGGTFRGWLQWVVAAAVYTVIDKVTFRVVDSSWDGLTEFFKGIFDNSDSDHFNAVIYDVLRNMYMLQHSMSLLVQAADSAEQVDSVHLMLRLHMARNIIINHVAFIKSCESCIAAIVQLAQRDSNLITDQLYSIEWSVKSLVELINTIIGREEIALQSLCLQGDSSKAKALMNLMRGLYDEIGSTAQIIGAMLYGKDFSLGASD